MLFVVYDIDILGTTDGEAETEDSSSDRKSTAVTGKQLTLTPTEWAAMTPDWPSRSNSRLLLHLRLSDEDWRMCALLLSVPA